MPPQTGQVRPGYVQLNDVAFRLRGPMRPILLTTPPPRFEIGRDLLKSEQILNVVTFGGPTGGIGVHTLQSAEEINTSWVSELRPFRTGRSLPELVESRALVADYRVNRGSIIFGFPSASIDAMYFMLQDVATSSYWITAWTGAPLGANSFTRPTAALSYRYPTDNNHYLFVADLAGAVSALSRSPANDITAAFAALGVTARFLVEYDNKVLRLDDNYECWSSADNGATWTTRGKLPFTPSQIGAAEGRISLLVHPDTSGNDQVYAWTSYGLYILDFSNARWRETKLMLDGIRTQGGTGTTLGLAAVSWRGDIYLTAGGMEVLRYTAGETALVSVVGPNRIDGLPDDFAGHIVSMTAGYNELYALFVRKYTLSGAARVRLGIMAYNGAAWRIVYTADLLQSTLTFGTDPEAGVGSIKAIGGYLYFTTPFMAPGIQVIRFLLPQTIYNPRVVSPGTINTNVGYRYEITPWINAFNEGRKKLATTAFIRTVNMSATPGAQRTARLWWALDGAESTWTDFYNKDTGVVVGDLTTDALHELSFNTGRTGIAFDSLRLRLGMHADTSPPVNYVPYFGFYFLIIPRQRFGYTFTIEIEDNVGQRATAQLQRVFLETLLPKDTQDPQLVKFVYRSPEIDTENTIYGFITRLVGDEQSGSDYSGRYTISFIAVVP